jgi:phage tail-like protein
VSILVPATAFTAPSARGPVSGVGTPVSLADLLPEVFRRHDPNIARFAEALDDVLAPIWLTLDCYDAYLDPMLAPPDFLELLAAWVGLGIDRNWSPDQTRRLVATAVELYRWRGTRRGLVELVRAYTGVEPEITDSGGTTWSRHPGSAPPGDPEPAVHVLVEVPADVPVDLARFTRLIAANVPAHVAVSVDVRRRAPGDGDGDGDGAADGDGDGAGVPGTAPTVRSTAGDGRDGDGGADGNGEVGGPGRHAGLDPDAGPGPGAEP